tara:strand:- start:404 stop:559 length:156 start_codon:yes stop_codon:yes gene_type:complete
MKLFKKLKEKYDQIVWKNITQDYCDSLKGAKMGLKDRDKPRQDDPPSSPQR